jgi:hypothetical protein
MLVAVALLAAGGATALAQATPEGPTVGDLKQELEQRDAIISDLLRRVEELERSMSKAGIAPETPRDQAAPPAPAAPVQEPAGTTPAEVAEPAAPGQFEVDEDAVERALERTLVQTGALLLPPGKIEVEPSFSYTRREDDAPTFVFQDGSTFAGETERRRDEFEAGLAMRLGLPFDSQLELNIPYRYVDQSSVTSIGFGAQDETSGSGSAFGDVSVGLAHTLLRERGWLPDLVGRVRWDTDTGERVDDGVALGGGFNEISGSMTAIKRQDPLAFVGSISYETAFESDGIDPGDELGFALGAFLAASPETSLRFVFDQRFIDEVEVGGQQIEGSDQTIGTLTLGASSVLGRGVLLDLAGSVGLTDDGPDYSLLISLPIRLDMPFLSGR